MLYSDKLWGVDIASKSVIGDDVRSLSPSKDTFTYLESSKFDVLITDAIT